MQKTRKFLSAAVIVAIVALASCSEKNDDLNELRVEETENSAQIEGTSGSGGGQNKPPAGN